MQLLMPNWPYNIELYEGVPHSIKISTVFKRPPIMLHINYEGIAHHMTLIGSFFEKDPTMEKKDFHCAGRNLIRIFPNNNDRLKTFDREAFYITLLGDQNITVRLSFGGSTLPETRGKSRGATASSKTQRPELKKAGTRVGKVTYGH